MENNLVTRKQWTAQQADLRNALASRSRFNEAIELFRAQHAAVHTAEISGNGAWSLQDEVMSGLPEPLCKSVPAPDRNSIAWLLWHITRIEDMTINTLCLCQPQVWTTTWAGRLGFSSPECGAGMNESEVAEFSAQISPRELLAYRSAVGCRTREGIARLDANTARELVPTALVQNLAEEGSITARAGWLFEYYCNRSRAFFLTRTATSHNFIHLNEAGRIKSMLIRK